MNLPAAARLAEEWLARGYAHEQAGQRLEALRAYFQAVTGAQRQGYWRDEASTPPQLLDLVLHAATWTRQGKALLLRSCYEDLRGQHGAQALHRVDKAVEVHLRKLEAEPPSEHQKPRFFYFPDLPPGPYHDPFLQPWLPALQGAWTQVRDEAVQALQRSGGFPSFFRRGESAAENLQGHGVTPAWDALFFYRRGQRIESTHRDCPFTSQLLEQSELCRIDGEAPEICFSVLAPHTDILPHHGVTNVRLVLHLPLLIPEGCALNVHGGGEHAWRPGEPMMFDDTYLHEAWNRSDSPRIVLLMDCWNPHLAPVEREAVKRVLEIISAYGHASAELPSAQAG